MIDNKQAFIAQLAQLYVSAREKTDRLQQQAVIDNFNACAAVADAQFGHDNWKPAFYSEVKRLNQLKSAPRPPPAPPPISSIGPKTIVFCADGTFNGMDRFPDGSASGCDASNVLKLFRWMAGEAPAGALASMEEAERVWCAHGDTVGQISKYLYGVGSMENWLVRALSGTGGAGLIERLIRGYTFISRHYNQGDTIVLTGFSRGAYTARALAEWITEKGLLDRAFYDANNREEAYRLAGAAWRAWQEYRAELDARHGTESHFRGLARQLRGLLDQLPPWFQAQAPQLTLYHPAVAAVAVWDTVGSMGIVPKFVTSPNGQLMRRDLFMLTDVRLPSLVERALHAISLDEERVDFTPSLWDRDPRVRQRLFSGWHSDVGGGYPPAESGLSDIALVWMQEQLVGLVRFDDRPAGVAPDAGATAHMAWPDFPLSKSPRHRREFDGRTDLELDDSIYHRRLTAAVTADPGRQAAPYAPDNLPWLPPAWVWE